MVVLTLPMPDMAVAAVPTPLVPPTGTENMTRRPNSLVCLRCSKACADIRYTSAWVWGGEEVGERSQGMKCHVFLHGSRMSRHRGRP